MSSLQRGCSLFSLLELSASNPPLICQAFALLPKPVYITVAFSALNVPCFYFKRTWQSVPSQEEQSSAKSAFLPHACFEPNAKVPPRVRHSASVLTVLSKAPDSRQAEVFHSFLLALHLHRALTQQHSCSFPQDVCACLLNSELLSSCSGS